MPRIDRVLSRLGYGSRKEVKQILRQKRVLINEEVVIDPKTNFDTETQHLRVDGEELVYHEWVYILLNKPQGYITSTEEGEQATVMDLILDPTPDLAPVGRLDKDTEGLLLLTNDGALAHHLLSPKHHVDKTYYVECEHPLTQGDFEKIEAGLILEGKEPCAPAHIEPQEKGYALTIHEGKYHQIKRMMETLGNQVTYLQRIKMGPLVLDSSLALGESRYLTEQEKEALQNA